MPTYTLNSIKLIYGLISFNPLTCLLFSNPPKYGRFFNILHSLAIFIPSFLFFYFLQITKNPLIYNRCLSKIPTQKMNKSYSTLFENFLHKSHKHLQNRELHPFL